jgi:hypothetical protein
VSRCRWFECALTGCTFPVEVDGDTFKWVRQNPLWFFVAPGHEQLGVEDLIERRDGI